MQREIGDEANSMAWLTLDNNLKINYKFFISQQSVRNSTKSSTGLILGIITHLVFLLAKLNKPLDKACISPVLMGNLHIMQTLGNLN